jgi:hypothetical protein
MSPMTLFTRYTYLDLTPFVFFSFLTQNQSLDPIVYLTPLIGLLRSYAVYLPQYHYGKMIHAQRISNQTRSWGMLFDLRSFFYIGGYLFLMPGGIKPKMRVDCLMDSSYHVYKNSP